MIGFVIGSHGGGPLSYPVKEDRGLAPSSEPSQNFIQFQDAFRKISSLARLAFRGRVSGGKVLP